MSWKDEKELTYLLLFFSMFVTVVLSPTIGTIFLGFGFIYLIGINDRLAYEFSLGKSKYNTFILIGMLTAVFIFISSVFYSYFTSTAFNLFSSIQLLSSSLVIPISIDEPYIRFIVWGITIPILETVFFLGVVGKYLSKKLNVNRFDLSNVNTYVLSAMVGAIASLFHIVSQAYTPEALIIDFIFFSMSMMIVLYLNELKQACGMHILINSLVTLTQLGII